MGITGAPETDIFSNTLGNVSFSFVQRTRKGYVTEIRMKIQFLLLHETFKYFINAYNRINRSD